MNEKPYWFSDYNEEDDPFPLHWSPWLQLNGYVCSLSIGFKSKFECDKYIQEEVLGADFRE